MIELKQGSIEAFRFDSWRKPVLRHGGIAGYTIPGGVPLAISRYVDIAVLLLTLGCFLEPPAPKALLMGLWIVEAAHLLVKTTLLWRPVRMDESRPVEILAPRLALRVEHAGFLISIIFLSAVSLQASAGYGWTWIAVMLVAAFMFVRSSPIRAARNRGN
jgi:hypothetical protein